MGFGSRFGVAVALAAAGALPAAAQEAAPKWGPHVDVDAKPGTKRDVGEADFFLPLMQDGRTLFFGSARLRIADHDNKEGNLGLGVRRMLEGGWNIGGYGYFDRRRTDTGNKFSQVTLGAEALGPDWDLRANAYVPQGSRVRDLGSTTTGGVSAAAIVGTAIQVTTSGTTTTLREERALRGYDAEAGWRLPVFDLMDSRQLRAYLGGYRFSDSAVTVSGPRARLELAMAELPWLWSGAQLFLGAETQHDDARGSQSFVSVRLRIPLGGEKDSGRRMNYQERRMTAPVVRDVDIVTQARSVVTASTPAVVETAMATAGGQAITVLSSAGTNGAALPAAVTAAGANSVVILSGTFNTAGTITTLNAGQTLMGAGSLSVRTPSGRTVVLTTPAATLTGNVGLTNYTVVMANNSTLMGMTINNTDATGNNAQGVLANSVSNASILNNTITSTETGGGGTAHGIDVIFTSSSILIRGNAISASGGALALGIQVNGVGAHPSATVAGNTLNVFGAFTSNAAVDLSGANILSGSSGNTIVAGTCRVSAAGIGSTVTFTNAAACGP